TPLADSTTSGSPRPGMGPYGCQTCCRSSASSSATDRSGIGGEVRSGTAAADGDQVGPRLLGRRDGLRRRVTARVPGGRTAAARTAGRRLAGRRGPAHVPGAVAAAAAARAVLGQG